MCSLFYRQWVFARLPLPMGVIRNLGIIETDHLAVFVVNQNKRKNQKSNDKTNYARGRPKKIGQIRSIIFINHIKNIFYIGVSPTVV